MRIGLMAVTLPALERVADLGFDLVHNYHHGYWSEMNTLDTYFDTCQKLGLKVICSVPASLCTFTNSSWHGEGIAQIEHIKDHPALAGWYMADEPEIDQALTPSWFAEIHAFLLDAASIIPNRYVATCRLRPHLGRYPYPGSHYLWSSYPIGRWKPGGVAWGSLAWEMMRRRYHSPQRPVYPIIQTHDTGRWVAEPYREPSEREMAWMCWHARKSEEVWFFPGMAQEVRHPKYCHLDYDITRPGRASDFARWLRYLGR